jgi:hypothetical protein
MNKDNKNKGPDNTDEKIHLSDVIDSFTDETKIKKL